MYAWFWTLVFVGLINMILVDAGISEIPFAEAHVKAHRKRICITVSGKERCIRMEKSPGDAEEIAKLFRVFIENTESNNNKKNKKYTRRGPARVGRNPASPTPARRQKNIIDV